MLKKRCKVSNFFAIKQQAPEYIILKSCFGVSLACIYESQKLNNVIMMNFKSSLVVII